MATDRKQTGNVNDNIEWFRRCYCR